MTVVNWHLVQQLNVQSGPFDKASDAEQYIDRMREALTAEADKRGWRKSKDELPLPSDDTVRIAKIVDGYRVIVQFSLWWPLAVDEEGNVTEMKTGYMARVDGLFEPA